MKHMAIVLLYVVLAGCGGLRSSRPAEQVYVLHAAPSAAAAGQPVSGVLRVPRPEVQPGLDTSRIALARAGNELDYFADSRWGEALPKVLAAFAVESISHSGSFETVVGAAPAPILGDFDLLLTVRHFEAVYGDGAPKARVAFDCVLLAGTPRQALGRCDAETEESAGENRLGAIVGALERAAQKAMLEAGGKAAALARAVRR